VVLLRFREQPLAPPHPFGRSFEESRFLHRRQHLLEQVLVEASLHQPLVRWARPSLRRAGRCQGTITAVFRGTDISLVVGANGRVGRQVVPSRAAEAVVLLLIDQLGFQVLAVSYTAAPEGDVGSHGLLLQRANDGRRAIAAIGGRFTNRDLVLIFDSLELREVGLIVVPGSGRDFRIQDDPTVGVDRLMDFILELPQGSLLLRQRGIGVGATAVGLVR